MERTVCGVCNAAILSSEAVFCHKCGARIDGADERIKPQPQPTASAGAAPGEIDDSRKHEEKKEINDSENAAGPGGVSKTSPAHPDWSFRNFWLEFQRNYYRLPFTASVVIMFAAIIYAFSPLDFVSGAPLISWIDDALILVCASINLLHCGVDISKHSENVTFQRIKLMIVPLSAIVIFFMWFCVNIVLILFNKQV